MSLERLLQIYNEAQKKFDKYLFGLIPTKKTAVTVISEPSAEPADDSKYNKNAMGMLGLLDAPDVIVVKDKDDNGGWG